MITFDRDSVTLSCLATGEDDCGDGTDERSCTVIHCPAGHLLCAGGAQCVATNHVCDGDRGQYTQPPSWAITRAVNTVLYGHLEIVK